MAVPPAYMGFVGFVKVANAVVRATSCDIKLSQEVTKPEVVDGAFDRTVYQLGPKIVGGSITYPAVMGDVANNPTAVMANLCILRHGLEARLNKTTVEVKYTTNNASFRYTNCIVNSFNFKVAQSDLITITSEVIAEDREVASLTTPNLVNSRVATWNDAVVELGTEGGIVGGEYIRSFDSTINNNAERYYTLNGKLAPQDIQARKRDVTGSVVLLGRHPILSQDSADNQDRCRNTGFVRYGYQLQKAGCAGTLLIRLPNIVYQIEEIALSTDIFETTVAWHAFPNSNVNQENITVTTA